MAEPREPSPPNLTTPSVIKLPSAVDRLAARASRLSWWIIILVIGLVLALYAILTTAEYRRAYDFFTTNLQLSTSDYLRVTYLVNLDGQTQKVVGTLVNHNGDQQTVRTVDPVVEMVPANLVSNVQKSTGTCPPGSPATCRPPNLVTLSIDPRTVEGSFYTETATEYRIQTPDLQIVSVLKVDTRDSRKLTPENCPPDISGTCHIVVTVPASQVSGVLLSDANDKFVVQTVSPEYVTFKTTDIEKTIGTSAGQCALNNLYSCQQGIFLTGFLTVSAFSLATVVGLVLALMRISSNVFLRNGATLYIEVVRGIPILVILFLFYFAIGPAITDAQGNPMPEITRAILGLAAAYAAFLAEIFRAGIQSISRGQMEAARSLGMTYFQAMRHVILPQAVRVVLPPLGNDFIAMLKDTSLVAAISLAEMAYLATQLSGRTLRPFPSFITLAVLYLCMTLVLSFIVRSLEYRVKLPG